MRWSLGKTTAMKDDGGSIGDGIDQVSGPDYRCIDHYYVSPGVHECPYISVRVQCYTTALVVMVWEAIGGRDARIWRLHAMAVTHETFVFLCCPGNNARRICENQSGPRTTHLGRLQEILSMQWIPRVQWILSMQWIPRVLYVL